MGTNTAISAPGEVNLRSELVQRLLARVERLSTRLGEVALAAEIQLLKRDMVQAHRILADRPQDNNFLSVVTLVEGMLACLSWKDYSPVVLQALRCAFTVGTGHGEISLPEYDAVRRYFKKAGLPTGPTISLESSDEEDVDGSKD